MARVYDNAYLVIAATRARDSAQGVFNTWPASVGSRPSYTSTTANNRPIPLFLRLPQRVHRHFSQSAAHNSHADNEIPLLSRAWVL